MTARVRIATRRSRLALWQAAHVAERLRAAHPGLAVELAPMTTRGDELLGASLAAVGGKGLFVKELEAALAEGRAEIAVHSMKDVPWALPAGFALAAITAREDPRDAFVSVHWRRPDELPAGARVGTSSLRRASQLLARRPDLVVQPLRGNVETRLAKLDRGECAALVLAAAGLRRLGLAGRIRALLEPEQSLPAPGQGALAIECLEARTDLRALVAPLADPEAEACVRAERAVSRCLAAGCTVPLAAYAELHGAGLRLRALVASPDGARIARAEALGPAHAPEALGAQVAELLNEQGARAILAALVP